MIGKVLLTGSSGFVGRQVLKALCAKDASIRLVIREGADVPTEHSDNFDRVIKTPDMFAESESWWAETCEGVDTVINVAWYAEPGKYLQSPKNLDCLIGTLKLARGAVKAGIRRFVGIGTCFEYDLTKGELSTETPLKPLNPYAGAKAAAYLGLSQCLPIESVEFAWCRLFYLYGEGEDARRLVPYIRSKLSSGEIADLTIGDQVRDFLDVSEAGRMITEAAQSKTQGAINICTGIPVTVRQLAEKIADEYGSRDLLRFGSRQENHMDPPCVIGIKTDLVN